MISNAIDVEHGEEPIYRRYSGWSQKGSSRPVPPRYFRPRKWRSDDAPGDADGLSVSQGSISEPADVSKCPVTGFNFSVAAVFRRVFGELGLSIQPQPTEHDRGHALVPEMNSLDYRDDPDKRDRIDEWAVALSMSATVVLEVPE